MGEQRSRETRTRIEPAAARDAEEGDVENPTRRSSDLFSESGSSLSTVISRIPRANLGCPPATAMTVNAPLSEAELAAVRHSVNRGTPDGSQRWVSSAAVKLGLESSLRPRATPRKET